MPTSSRIVSTLAAGALALAASACGAEPAAPAKSPAPTPAAAQPPAADPSAAQPSAAQPAGGTNGTNGTASAAAAPQRPEGIRPGERIPAFKASGARSGATADLASQQPGAVTVYTVGSTTCPYTNKYAGRMAEIEATFAAKGVSFVWLYSNSTETDADKTAWHAEKKLGGLFVIDRDAVIAKALGAQRTPEVVVTAADGTITYRGAIDDGGGDPKRAKAQHLTDALEATLAGKPVSVAETTPAG